MKTVLVVRHAKSSWGDLTLPDFDRPLNDRGQRNAPDMAERMVKRGIDIDAFVTSTAKRAMQTASHFIRAYSRPDKDLILREELYHAPPNVYTDIIGSLNDDFSTIAIFGHNPGITAFVNQLSLTKIDEMPTCGVFAVNAKVNSWKDFPAAEKKFLFFDSPKAGSS